MTRSPPVNGAGYHVPTTTRGASGSVTEALSLIAALPPGEVVHRLGDRRIRLAAQRTETQGVIDGALAAGLYLLFLVEEQCRLFLVEEQYRLFLVEEQYPLFLVEEQYRLADAGCRNGPAGCFREIR